MGVNKKKYSLKFCTTHPWCSCSNVQFENPIYLIIPLGWILYVMVWVCAGIRQWIKIIYIIIHNARLNLWIFKATLQLCLKCMNEFGCWSSIKKNPQYLGWLLLADAVMWLIEDKKKESQLEAGRDTWMGNNFILMWQREYVKYKILFGCTEEVARLTGGWIQICLRGLRIVGLNRLLMRLGLGLSNPSYYRKVSPLIVDIFCPHLTNMRKE